MSLKRKLVPILNLLRPEQFKGVLNSENQPVSILCNFVLCVDHFEKDLSTYKLLFAEQEEGRLQLVLLALRHGEKVEACLRYGHVQALGQLARFAGCYAVIKGVAEIGDILVLFCGL